MRERTCASFRRLKTLFVITLLCAAAAKAAAQPEPGLIIDLFFEDPDFTLEGAAGGDMTGKAVALCDFNGDGRNDMVIGAPGFDFMGRGSAGVIYVLLTSDTLSPTIDLSVSRADLIRIYGPAASQQVGLVIACGDINNDNRDDIVCGLPSASPNGIFFGGEVHIVYGSAAPTDVDLAMAVSGVTVVQGAGVFHRLGWSLGVGDVDNDGHDDVLAGAPFADTPAGGVSGRAYLVYGGASLGGVIDLASATSGFTEVFGERSNDTFGTACYIARIDGDDFADLVVGAPEALSEGMAYMIPGGASLPDTIATADTPAGITRIFSAQTGSSTGAAFCSGDVFNDGNPDLLIAATDYSPPGKADAGTVFIVPGATSWPDTIDLAELGVSTRIDGPVAGFSIGSSIAVGDHNVDGFGDVTIGIPEASPKIRSEAGEVKIVYGVPLMPPPFDLGVPHSYITSIWGEKAADNTGTAVASGRIDNDSSDDLIIGAANATVGGAFAVGKVVVILGGAALTPTSVDVPPLAAGRRLSNFPNPFSHRTTLSFDLTGPENVRLRVYDVRGRLVTTLLTGRGATGPNHIGWDGTDASGRLVPSGVYIVRLESGRQIHRRKIVLIR